MGHKVDFIALRGANISSFDHLVEKKSCATLEKQLFSLVAEYTTKSGIILSFNNTGPQKNTFFLGCEFQYDIRMYFSPLKPNPQPVEPLNGRIMT